MPKDRSTLNPNLGLYLDRVPLAIPARGLSNCLNIRIVNGQITRDNMGYGPFPDDANAINLDGQPVTGIDNFFPRDGGQHLLFLTTRDIYRYVEAGPNVVYLNDRYETGTVSVNHNSTAVTGSGTAWSTNAKAGDFIAFASSGETDPAYATHSGWYEIDSVGSDTGIVLASAFQHDTAGNLSGADYTIRKTFTGDVFDAWSFETFPAAENLGVGSDGDRWYATNGISGEIIAWDGNDDQIYRPDFGTLTAALFVSRYKNHMIWGNITVSGENRAFSIRSSNTAEPENLSTGVAAEFVVHDGVDPIIQAVPLGDSLVIYGERSITMCQFVGGDVRFVFRQVISGIGLISSRAFGDFGDFHEFLGSDAQYRFDGITVQEIGYQVWREIIRQQSPQRLGLIHAHFDEENGELLWIMPLTTDANPEAGPPEKAFVEHYLELVGEDDPSPYTVRELPSTATGFYEREATLTWDTMVGTWAEQNIRWNDRFLQGSFPINLFGTNGGDIMVLNDRDSFNGASITSFARFGRRALGDIRRKGTIMRVYPFCTRLQGATYTLDVRLHLTNDPGGATTEHGPFAYDLTQSTSSHFVSPRRTGRFVELEFRTTGTGRPWTLQGYELDVVPAGER